MNRVRNFSGDGSDGHTHQLSESSEVSAGKGSGSDAKLSTRKVGGQENMLGSDDALLTEAPSDREKNAQFHTGPDSLDPNSAGMKYRQDTGSISPKSPQPHLGHSPAQLNITSEKPSGKDLKRQIGEGDLAANVAQDRHVSSEVSAHQPAPDKVQSKTRGHIGDFHQHLSPHTNEDTSSHGSSPTIPQARSDIIAPMYPQGLERGRLDNECSSFREPKEQQQWDNNEQRTGREFAEERLGDRAFADDQRKEDASKRHGDRVLEVQVKKRQDKEAWTLAHEQGKGHNESQQQVCGTSLSIKDTPIFRACIPEFLVLVSISFDLQAKEPPILIIKTNR